VSATIYPMAPLIRFTLISLYAALIVPLPVLAPASLVPVLLGAFVVGLVLVWALTSEQVVLDGTSISVGYPAWCRWLLRRGWTLRFEQITGLTPVGTSQGGRVFYVRQQGAQHPGELTGEHDPALDLSAVGPAVRAHAHR